MTNAVISLFQALWVIFRIPLYFLLAVVAIVAVLCIIQFSIFINSVVIA